ncbi:hypothetical protein C7I87_20905 [Mesorhizobium sp. SARCC-RB16n]|uniref:hypothetical protein n=1 Tax=Mesorhizobium sp. SARCC-RB16n TaxID=2116687 RepID=UPI00122F0921|nr:hypothetical protein [Mesorhizobium sp. SARCC-RB16n]KAA3448614.1 hypothetical protein C7I87_20905 [Mesorhizobium sp. SARCC-RB16n]
MAQILSPDATIADIVTKLDDPKEYLRAVFSNMHECTKKFGSARVYIGLSGEGKRPHYRIEPDRNRTVQISDAAFRDAILGRGKPNRADREDLEYMTSFTTAYNGSSHKTLKTEGGIGRNNWSNRSMTVEEIQELRESLDGKRRPI